MAEGGVTESVRQDWHRLLVALKTTCEGLLATHSSNVWNTYGGLNRISNDMDKIMNHRLKVTQGPHGSSLDFWNFVHGLRWLNPTMAPTIEQFHKMTRGGSSSRSPSRGSAGKAWLRQSLLEHSLSNQLSILTANRQYLLQHYEGDAYLCQSHYLQAMLQYLYAVEQNRATLLADINPILLTWTNSVKTHIEDSNSHICGATVPASQSEDMIRSRNSANGRLVPMPVKTLQNTTIMTVTDHQAQPLGLSIYREESATEALRNVLNRSDNAWEDDEEMNIGIGCQLLNDPLMNMQIISVEGTSLPKKSSSMSGLNNFNHNSANNKLRLKAKSRTVGLLDRILNDNDEMFTKSIASEESNAKKCDFMLTDNSNVAEDPPTGSQHTTCDVIDEHQSKEDLHQSNTQLNNQNIARVESTNQSASTKRYSHQRSASDFGVQRKSCTRERYRSVDLFSPETFSSSLPVSEVDSSVYHRRKDGAFLQPAKGQSLRSFLSSQDFHTCAELDKENAHFTLAEGLISAIEQMKWNQIIRPQDDATHEDGDSDDEIQQLKQRIRIRRRERAQEKAENFPPFFDDKSDSLIVITPAVSMTTSDTPTSSPCFSSVSQDSSISSDEIHDQDIAEDDIEMQQSNLTTLSNSGLSLSMASLYSDIEIQKSNAKLEKSIERQISFTENNTNALLSAESVAMSLLRRFSEKQLPKASELEWLVSEQDAPQQLLPLPDSYPISPDDSENSVQDKLTARTRIRGNMEWAPPRAQIIFSIHPPPKRKLILAKQNYRCAGCGAKVEPGYTKRYRYCDYLGKYFCPCCHSNDLAYIPGRILQRWDFTKYYVSNFSRDLLKRIYKDPLFNVMDINETLYRKVRPLEVVADCRRQLRHLTVFLKTCRLGNKHLERLEKLPTHWTNDIHIFSMAELVEIKKNEHIAKLKPFVNESIGHISQCPLCQAKGFICEVCRNMDDIIFPFDLHKVTQCPACRSCFHRMCYVPDNCPKCARIQSRKHHLEQQFSDDEEEEISTDTEELLPVNQKVISR